MSYVIGSPEWFYNESLKTDKITFGEDIEKLRMEFLKKYSPECMGQMSGCELLERVFGDDDSMLYDLMFSDDYRQFGAPGSYKYLWIVYKEGGASWKYKEGSHAEAISYAEAEKKAVFIRDKLLECVSIIERNNLDSLNAYEKVERQISHVFFYKYSWVLKYFQMIFPYYFPGMYADNTLARALNILGLPDYGKSKRFLNAGELALFIRRCNINNIVFNKIYSGMWGWDTPQKSCDNAKDNNCHRMEIPQELDLSYYKLSPDNENTIDVSLSVNKKSNSDNGDIIQNGKCRLCGLMNKSLLTNAFIKPKEDCVESELNDANNRIELCPNHYKLFTEGWITFDESGKIIISDRINSHDKLYLNVNSSMKIAVNKLNQEYIKYHREYIFK